MVICVLRPRMHVVQLLMLASHAIKSCLLLFSLTCHLKAVKNVVGMVSAFSNHTFPAFS